MEKSLFIKICGITKAEDALAAVRAGADAVGFIAYPRSPRYISAEKVAEIIAMLDGEVRKVGVFVNASPSEISAYLGAGIDTIQLHGDESAEFAEKCRNSAEVWKAVRPVSETDIMEFLDFPADKILVDAFHKTRYGGTGRTVNRELAKFAVDSLPRPVLIAGGISPANCGEIAAYTMPFGLDVNSGVESEPGVKNHAEIAKLFKLIRGGK